jgi:cytochrome c5
MATRDPDFPLVPHFTEPHVRIQASGTLGQGAGNEIWTMGCKVVCTAAGTPGVAEIPDQADVADCAAAGLEAFAELILNSGGGGGPEGALVSDDVAITEVKAYAVGPDNHADVTRQTEYRFPTGPTKGGAAPDATNTTLGRNPYATSVVVTFRGTQFRKGLAAFGRLYIPGANVFASGGTGALKPLQSGLMDPVTVNAFAVAGAAFIHFINNAQITGQLLKRVSNVATTTKLQSLVRWQPVTIVDVDSRPDTVRRRQNKIGGRGKVTIAV